MNLSSAGAVALGGRKGQGGCTPTHSSPVDAPFLILNGDQDHRFGQPTPRTSQATARHAMHEPRYATARHGTARHATPRHATPRTSPATPHHTTHEPIHATARHARTGHTTNKPRHEQAKPRHTTPCTNKPRTNKASHAPPTFAGISGRGQAL